MPRAAEFNGYANLTSDYVFRGVSYSDQNPALQLGGDLSWNSGAYFGVWGSTVDIANGPGRQRDWEVDYYVGLVRRLGTDWALNVNGVAYTFPGASGNADYNYEELALGANYRDVVFLEFAFSPDLFGSGKPARNGSITLVWPLTPRLDASATAGHYDPSGLTGEDYSYFDVGITASLARAAVDIRYHEASQWVPIVSTPETAGSRFTLSVKLPF